MRVIRLIKHYKNIQKTHFSKIRTYIFRNATDNRKLGGNCIKEETNLTDPSTMFQQTLGDFLLNSSLRSNKK